MKIKANETTLNNGKQQIHKTFINLNISLMKYFKFTFNNQYNQKTNVSIHIGRVYFTVNVITGRQFEGHVAVSYRFVTKKYELNEFTKFINDLIINRKAKLLISY